MKWVWASARIIFCTRRLARCDACPRRKSGTIPRRGQFCEFRILLYGGYPPHFGVITPEKGNLPTRGQHRHHRVARDASDESFRAGFHMSLASLQSLAESRILLPNEDRCCGDYERSTPVPVASIANGSSSASSLLRSHSDGCVR